MLAFGCPLHSAQSREACAGLSAQVHARAHCCYAKEAHDQSVNSPLGRRPAVLPAVTNGGTGSTLFTARPSTSATRYRFGRPSSGNSAQRSGNTGRSPRDRNVCALEASTEPSLLDDDLSMEPPEDMIVAKLNRKCLGGCGKVHPPYECPNLTGDPEHQKKTFASPSSNHCFLPVWAITVTDDDDNEVNLIDLHDPDDQDSDADQDFP